MMTDFKPIVAKFPIVTTLLLESANISQLIRMWSERSALGQSIVGWACVNLALWMWWVWYKVMAPGDRLVRNCQAFGIFMNILVLSTVIYFRAHGQ